MCRMNKKGATPLAIALLGIVATVFLMGSAWYAFYTADNTFRVKIYNYRLTEKLYSEEGKIDFYLNDMVGRAAKEAGQGKDAKSKFIEAMKEEILYYRAGEIYIVPELSQVEEQLDESRVAIEGNYIVLPLELEIRAEMLSDGRTAVSARYSYQREFRAPFLSVVS